MQVRSAAAFCYLLSLTLLVLALPAQASPAAPRETPSPTAAVYLPALMRAPTPVPTNTPQPGTVSVLSDRGVDGGGAYLVYGEVLNNQAAPACTVRVAGRFYNAEGKFIDTAETYVMLPRLNAQQRAPFALKVYFLPAPISRHEVRVDSYRPCDSDYRMISVVSSEVRSEVWGRHVYGEVYNAHDVEIGWITVAVTYYDTYGRVSYTTSGSLDGVFSLEPGQTGYFTLDYPNDGAAGWSVQVEGSVYP